MPKQEPIRPSKEEKATVKPTPVRDGNDQELKVEELEERIAPIQI